MCESGCRVEEPMDGMRREGRGREKETEAMSPVWGCRKRGAGREQEALGAY